MPKSSPRILFFDIETAPNLSYVWGHYQQDVIAHEREWYMLCFGYRWAEEKRAKCIALTDYPKQYKQDPENDHEVVKALWELLDEADIVIGHNGDNFDIKRSNARFLKHGFPPPSPYKSIDTLKIARSAFKLNSNRLNDLGKYLGVGKKAPTSGFSTWAGCMRGDEKSWKTMIKYCAQDVDLLFDIYNVLRPWAKNHPNVTTYNGLGGCPRCGHWELIRRGFKTTKTRRYVQYQCKQCNSYCSERTTSEPSPDLV
jgi:DNA polymerase elongation subunit (family B)